MELQTNDTVAMPKERVVFVLVERDLEDQPQSKPTYWVVAPESLVFANGGLYPTGLFYPCGTVVGGGADMYAVCRVAKLFLGLTATADDFDHVQQFEGMPLVTPGVPDVEMTVSAYRYKGKLRKQDVVVAGGMAAMAVELVYMIDSSVAPFYKFNIMVKAAMNAAGHL